MNKPQDAIVARHLLVGFLQQHHSGLTKHPHHVCFTLVRCVCMCACDKLLHAQRAPVPITAWVACGAGARQQSSMQSFKVQGSLGHRRTVILTRHEQ
eukprot:scaffold61930_cov19-Tisochrysis_lutea.AAC.1